MSSSKSPLDTKSGGSFCLALPASEAFTKARPESSPGCPAEILGLRVELGGNEGSRNLELSFPKDSL